MDRERIDLKMVRHIINRTVADADKLGKELVTANVNEHHALIALAVQYLIMGVDTATLIGGPSYAIELLKFQLEELKKDLN